ncbi:hypothetical protein TSAR_001271, partial [Trichomalopsis sarcophagae]
GVIFGKNGLEQIDWNEYFRIVTKSARSLLHLVEKAKIKGEISVGALSQYSGAREKISTLSSVAMDLGGFRSFRSM